jgi:hypothetical protein
MRLFIYITLFINVLQSQAQTIHQSTYWTRIYLRAKLSEKYSLQFEADNRRFFNANQQLQFIAHIHLHRKLGKNTEGSLGFTYSDVWQGNLPVPELRPFQEFYIFQPFNERFRLTHRIRTEQRWFRNYANDHLVYGYNFKFRFRYQPRLEYRASEKWIFKINDELMYHNDGFDQNRIYGAVEYKFLKDLSLELGYLKLKQKRNGKDGYFLRDNVRVTFYKDLNWRSRNANKLN